MTTYTSRQLGTMAYMVDLLTETRRANARAGQPTTPDTVVLRFPSNHIAVAHWTQSEVVSAAARKRVNGEAPWRYVLDIGPNNPRPTDDLPRPLVVLSLQDVKAASRTRPNPGPPSNVKQRPTVPLSPESPQDWQAFLDTMAKDGTGGTHA